MLKKFFILVVIVFIVFSCEIIARKVSYAVAESRFSEQLVEEHMSDFVVSNAIVLDGANARVYLNETDMTVSLGFLNPSVGKFSGCPSWVYWAGLLTDTTPYFKAQVKYCDVPSGLIHLFGEVDQIDFEEYMAFRPWPQEAKVIYDERVLTVRTEIRVGSYLDASGRIHRARFGIYQRSRNFVDTFVRGVLMGHGEPYYSGATVVDYFTFEE